jgi:hypothetical protein
VIGGLATDREGNLYVSDITYGRVLKFPPFDRPGVVPQTNLNDLFVPMEITPEITPEAVIPTIEVTPAVELTVETTPVVEMTVESTPETTPDN